MAARLSDIHTVGINPDPAEVLHCDLNSAFAMTEQQANPLLRGRPVGITNRINDWSICITSSYEAKRQGIGIGTRQRDAKLIDPSFIMLESDAPKYQFVHKKMLAIFQSYSPVAYMKSIDEGIIDFRGMSKLLKGRSLEDIALEIKQRIREEIGDYFTVNIGIGQNRWLAKVAASFMKPNGLYTIDKDNLEMVYHMMDLLDLPYINTRNKLRLNEVGIMTPHQFFSAPYWVLYRQVFRSVLGHTWYLKLRGYETEVSYGIKSVGRSYVLEHRTSDPEELSLLLYKACHKISRRLNKNSFAARGLDLSMRYSVNAETPYDRVNFRHGWYERHMWGTAVRRADELYERALWLYNRSPADQVVAAIAMTSYGLEDARTDQPQLFEDLHARRERVEDALHAINDQFGEMMVVPASVAKSKNPMKDKIPFGTVRYFD